ncbi:hypothetical protein K2173_013922 [Erythroxylum novogranatense]|uniref:Oleosin n=1 Tax=Erythroxylum novogranatense TaxID=1862640 RepID=A0AAV8SCQ1_9ROSI|nr:hypothetical protein K2173_013922 [Erythroxylum novogranatense]
MPFKLTHQMKPKEQDYKLFGPENGDVGPSASKVLAVITMLPVGAGLLALAGITLVGTLIGLAITTPVFLLFSPVLVPAALVLAFAVTSFLASGAFGVTGLTSLSWFVNYFRQASQAVPEQLDQAKRRMQDMVGYVGQCKNNDDSV